MSFDIEPEQILIKLLYEQDVYLTLERVTWFDLIDVPEEIPSIRMK